MKKAPNLWTLKSLYNSIRSASVQINGEWVPARPLGFDGIKNRFRIAWLVFTGKADAVIWPGEQ